MQPQAPPQGLSEADQIKIELKNLRKHLNQLEPRARVAKQDPNLNTLLALKSAIITRFMACNSRRSNETIMNSRRSD